MSIEGANLFGALVALSVLESKIPVSFVPVSDAEICSFELTSLFRWSLKELPSSLSELKALNLVASAFSFLFYPQRVADFSEDREIGSNTLLLIDKAQGKDRENSSLPLNLSGNSNFDAVDKTFYQKGVLNREYLLDKNRLTAAVLSRCFELGATIVKQNPSNAVSFVCSHGNSKERSILLSNCEFPYRNAVRLFFHSTLVSFVSRTEGLLLNFCQQSDNEVITIEELNNLASRIGVHFSSTHLNLLKSELERKTNAEKQESDVFPDYSIVESVNSLPGMLKSLSKSFGKNIRKPSLPKCNCTTGITDFDFIKKTMDECDRLFDLAKQTAIPYLMFQQLFYSYGTEAIEWMTEVAFEQMSSSRDPQIIWGEAERLWKKRKEIWRYSDSPNREEA